MEKSRQKGSGPTSYKFRTGPVFRDLLYLLSLSFAVLLIYALLLITPPAKKSEVEQKAEFLIILEWDKESDDDVDIWIQDPAGHKVWYGHKSEAFLHLDKDDLGQINDSAQVNGEERVVYLNREVVSIRGLMPGEYITNVHLYQKTGFNLVNGFVQLIKLNPFIDYKKQPFTLKSPGEETTVFRFEMNEDGYIDHINQDQHRFIIHDDEGDRY